jgi:predicted transcriptional regulator
LAKRLLQFGFYSLTHLRFHAIVMVERGYFMKEELKVLKVMNEVTTKTDLNGFARMVDLTPTETIEQIQELLKGGLVRKAGSGYGITEKGKSALRAFALVEKGKEFYFYNDIDQPNGFHADNILNFYEILKLAPVISIEFHLYRGDFENWICGEIEDSVLVSELAKIKSDELKGEELRREILLALEKRYCLRET